MNTSTQEVMEKLCQGERFWDSDLTWNNNSWPEFTECFENTALTWIPCGFLLLASPLYILYLINRNPDSARSLTRLFICKQLLTFLMICLLIAELVNSTQQTSYFNDVILSHTTWLTIMIFHIILLNAERKKDIGRFPVLCLFWFLGSVTLLVQMYSAVQRETYSAEPYHFSMLTCRFILSSVLFILHCLSSHGSKYKEFHNPYKTASLPSLLFLTWIDPLLIKGFKKPLQSDDLYTLTRDNTAFNVLAKFQRSWDKEKKKCKIRRRKTQSKVLVDDEDMCDVPLQSLTQQDSDAEKSTEKPSHKQISFGQASFPKALMKSFWLDLIKTQVGMMARVVDNIYSPFVLGFFIDYINNEEMTWHGFIYTAVILILRALTISFAYATGLARAIFALRLQTTVMGSVFRKVLIVSPESRKESTTGEIINLMSVDATHVKTMFDNISWSWMCIIYFVAGIALTGTIVGYAVLAGLACVLLICVMNFYLLHKLRIYEAAIMKIRDERIKIMNEILNGIKVIKLYGWEDTFIKKITDIREKELKVLTKISIFGAIYNFAWRGALFWMNYFILVTFVMVDGEHYLDAKTAFVTLSYIGLVRLAVNSLPFLGRDFIKGLTSIRRLNSFMNTEDISLANLERDISDCLSVRISNGDFSWEKHGHVTLKSIDMEVEPGKLIAIVGAVGSGKSSLLSAMLGEMHRIKGHVNLNSSVAYVPQQAWIQNATVKNNILFGSSLRQDFYDEVVKDCSLESDFSIMAAGDQTEIGEKGINLSGGQKQRISLARAIYSEADIYLLDDPLSAVDSHVGRHIFDHVIGPNGSLKGKTRIMVTHGVQWLPEVDQIVVMDNGQIRDSGTMDELLAQNGDFARFLTQYFVQHGELDVQKGEEIDKDSSLKKNIFQRLISMTSESDGDSVKESPGVNRLLSVVSNKHNDSYDVSADFLGCDFRQSITSLHQITGEVGSVKFDEEVKTGPSDGSRLTTDEEAAGGRVSTKLYWHLWKGVGMGYSFIIFFFIIAYHVTYNYANYWVAHWNDDYMLSNFTALPANSTARHERNTYFIVIFTIIGLLQTMSVLVYSFLIYIRHVTACRKLHEKLLVSVMKAPMSYFDTTPMGRILNRFSQDIQTIDTEIFLDINDVINFFLNSLGVFITISITLPWFLVVIVPVILLVLLVQRLFVVNSCQVRRLLSNRRSPIYSHFSESLSGASVIRAYRAQDQFIKASNTKIDDCQQAACAAAYLYKWMYSRLDMVALIVVGSVCIFAVTMRDELTPGIIGLSVYYALEMSIIFCLGLEFFCLLETHIVSVERVREYSVLQSEAPWTIPDDAVNLPSGDKDKWPRVGLIEFKNYSTRYREGLDLVLNDITCTIRAGEKVGIVGRTGAGKSSMVLSLFRLIEAANGSIVINGVDISHIGLHTLRHSITILPQDPVLFAGTLRINLDPQEEKSDSEIWTALEHSYLKTFVMGLDDKLNHYVGEGGENFSLGQRQLLCLARTLLRKTKILILDEATASVDMDTDDHIQKTIRTEFSNCTILTIAHRLNTVIDYDRIMVLDKGCIKEFEPPSSLLSDSNSAFYSMAKEAGLV